MKYLLVLLLSKLLSADYMVNISPNNDVNESLAIAHQSNQNWKGKTHLLDMNVDVLYIILYNFEINDLLSMVEASPQMSPLASAVFRQQFKGYKISISRCNSNQLDCNHENVHQVANLKRIEIYKFNAILNVLKYFGNAIEQLNTENGFIGAKNLAEINRMANQYCTSSLTHLSLGKIEKDTFKQFIKPFVRIEELSMEITNDDIQPGIMPINEIFPKLLRLDVRIRSDIDASLFNCTLSNLEEIFVEITSDRHKKCHQLDDLLRKNPQIKSVQILNSIVSDVPYGFLAALNDHVPCLENLTMQSNLNFDMQNASLHFDNVKCLHLKTYHPSSIDQLSFSRLESLQMKYVPIMYRLWLKFFKQNHNLKRIHLEVAYREGSVQLVELMRELPNLREIILHCIESISVVNIITIIEEHAQLVNFQMFLSNKFAPDDLDTLRDRFECEWNIRESHHNIRNQQLVDVFVFKKKN